MKLGYNEFGYNENSVITNKFFSPNRSFYYKNQPGYNKTRCHCIKNMDTSHFRKQNPSNSWKMPRYYYQSFSQFPEMTFQPDIILTLPWMNENKDKIHQISQLSPFSSKCLFNNTNRLRQQHLLSFS